MEARPHIYTQYCRTTGNAKDEHESLEKPLNNSWNNPEHSQSFSKIPVSRNDS
jgi:hypothetical protein